ncbi:Piso0_000759 [Millerozyma farinosa CBS 7064]|uniref:Piso0_000759 protein n=1 Tax=Pichia sorbitophila (strain ATCC MYA-4447 / BCRC 22081 / CBS 7064 / NBRC 10061 / NRRL Y-12695) TaxID=559304 RepID=G8YRF6_PICSO|nr:Piso0_000759 [Millerozyma farinosa CBS 7064]
MHAEVQTNGRIQEISSEQEVVLKQMWAYLLKYFGFSLDIDDSDLSHPESYVASSVSRKGRNSSSLTRIASRESAVSTTGSTRSGFFGRRKSSTVDNASSVGGSAPPIARDSKRLQFISTQSSREKYVPVTTVSKDYWDVFSRVHHLAYDGDDLDTSEESEGSECDVIDDSGSFDSFITASTSISESEPEGRQKSVTSTLAGADKMSSSRNTPGRMKAARKLHPQFAQFSPTDILKSLYEMAKTEHFDNSVFRFLRARKLNCNDSLSMLLKSLNWRINGIKAEEKLKESDAPSYILGKNKGVLKNFQRDKLCICGRDNKNNPLVYFRAKLHFGSDSTPEEIQQYAILILEWSKFLLDDIGNRSECITAVFDLTGFSLKNADYSGIKFLAEVFSSHYPETLATLLIYNAPWIFFKVWSLVKNWLDPHVARKIHFVKNQKELSKFVDIKQVPKFMGGESKVDITYPLPSKEELHPPKKKDSEYRKLRYERDEMFVQFLEVTKKWIESTNPEVSTKYLLDKIDLGTRLVHNYIKLDPYMRCPGVYDRSHILDLQARLP